MKRWNGWGLEGVLPPFPAAAGAALTRRVGAGVPPRDAQRFDVVSAAPASRLPAHPLVSREAEVRVRHARGQAFPDLVALRSGRVGPVPDGVALPRSREEVRALLAWARGVGAHVIPYGGGTSVVGHVNPEADGPPVLTLGLERLAELTAFSAEDRLATFGAGVRGPALEEALRARGFTLGHFPQSFELSTLGGWVATRSRGQQALGYGRIEALFQGGTLETPGGTLPLPAHPASSTGPDVRELVLGSEGRLGVLTDVSVRVTPAPEREAFEALFLPDWAQARAAVRELALLGAPLSMLRLSCPVETALNLELAGHPRAVRLLSRVLALRGVAGGAGCMLVVGHSGSARRVDAGWAEARAVARRFGAVHVPRLGAGWAKHRYRGPYLRDALWERGWGVDTVETATRWSNVGPLVTGLEAALEGALAREGERVHAFTHLSHPYATGSNVYTTFVFRLGADADATLARWRALKAAACAAVLAHGGTVSHQHGIGTEHRPYVEREKGALGVAALRGVIGALDPEGRMNPGKLV